MTGQGLARFIERQPRTTVLRQAVGAVHHLVLHRIIHHAQVLFDGTNFVERRGETAHHCPAVGMIFQITLDDDAFAGNHLDKIISASNVPNKTLHGQAFFLKRPGKGCFTKGQHQPSLAHHRAIDGVQHSVFHESHPVQPIRPINLLCPVRQKSPLPNKRGPILLFQKSQGIGRQVGHGQPCP